MCLNHLKCFTNVIMVNSKGEKCSVGLSLYQESAGKEHQAGTEMQDRENSKVGERETELKRKG